MTNIDTRLASYKARAIQIETSKREAAEDLKELRKEMKSNEITKDEIGGVFLAVKRHFESEEKKATRTAQEAVADMLASEGVALFAAAVA